MPDNQGLWMHACKHCQLATCVGVAVVSALTCVHDVHPAGHSSLLSQELDAFCWMHVIASPHLGVEAHVGEKVGAGKAVLLENFAEVLALKAANGVPLPVEINHSECHKLVEDSWHRC